MDDLVTCPYNVAHTIQRKRFQTHLVKCSRNQSEVFQVCCYNATHHIRRGEMKAHLEGCQDRAKEHVKKLEEILLHNKKGFLNLPRASTPPPMELTEDWGAEADRNKIKTYDPMAANKDKIVLWNIQNKTPSERKAFRAAEKIRLDALKEEKERKDRSAKTGPSLQRIPPAKDDSSEESEEDDWYCRASSTVASTVASYSAGKEKLEQLARAMKKKM